MTQQSPCNNATDIQSTQVNFSEVTQQKAAFWKVWTGKSFWRWFDIKKESSMDLSSPCVWAIKISLRLMHISSSTSTTCSPLASLYTCWKGHLVGGKRTSSICICPSDQWIRILASWPVSLTQRKAMEMGTERRIYSATLTKTKNLRCIIRLQSRLRAGTCQLAN